MKKRILKDHFVIAYAMVIAISCVGFLVSTLKLCSLPELGYVINNDFLKLLVQYKNYEIVQDASAVLAVTFGVALVLFVSLKYKFTNYQKNRRKWNLACALIVFPFIGISASIGPNLDFPTRLKAEPKLHKEFVVDKYKSHGSKSGTSYHLLFNSGSSFMVGSKKYNAAFVRQEYYTVYQGDILIQIFSPDTYRLAE